MKAILFLAVLCIPLVGFDPPVPCPSSNVIAGAGDVAIKWSAGCNVPLDMYCRTPESQERLAARIGGADARVAAAEAEITRLREALLLAKKDLEIAQVELANLRLVVQSQECPPIPECPWLKPSAAGFAVGLGTGLGVWLGTALAQ